MALPIETNDDGTPHVALTIAGQGIRAFNHRSETRFLPGRSGWQQPSDAARCLAALVHLLGELDQAFAHLSGAVEAQLTDGGIAITDPESPYSGNPAAAVAVARTALENARVTTHALRHALSDAHSALAYATSTDGSPSSTS